MTCHTVYNQRLLEKSLISHRVKCRMEAVNNLSRPLESWKMLKISLSKQTLIKISESVIPHETLFQHQFGFFVQLTWNVTNVTFIFAPIEIQNLKRKLWGDIAYYAPRLKKWGGHVPRIPHLIAPMAMPIYTSIIKFYGVCFWIRDNQRYRKKQVTFLREPNPWCAAVSHMCTCKILTVSRK